MMEIVLGKLVFKTADGEWYEAFCIKGHPFSESLWSPSIVMKPYTTTVV